MKKTHTKWRRIKDYPFYIISNYGEIISYNYKKPFYLKPSTNKGYQCYCLAKEGRKKWFSCHRLVLTAFKGEAPDGFDGSHLDNNKQNNHIDNLIWESRSDNIMRKHEHGTFRVGVGERQHKAKLNTEKVLDIRQRYSDGETTTELANDFKVHRKTIYHVIKRNTWKHI